MRKLLAALATLALTLTLAAPPAGADSGSNYEVQFQTDWQTAGDPNTGHVIVVDFKPATNYWKVGVRGRCNTDPYFASEGIDLNLAKEPFTSSWRFYGPMGLDNGTAGVVEWTYPGPAGESGFHTPDYNGYFRATVWTQAWTTGTPRCEFKFVIYSHT